MKTLNFAVGETNKHSRKLLNQLSFLILSFFTLFLISCSCMPPVASNQTFEACDNIGNNVIIGMVEASDPENNALTYKIISDDNNLFKIDSRSGILSLVSNQSLDYSSSTQHTITVQVSNLSLTKDVIITIDVFTVPTLTGTFTFTYNQIVDSLAMNNGGSVESFRLISGTIPAGLKLTNKSGQLVIEGTPTRVTLDGAGISAVSLGIEASNKCGLSRASSVNVTVNPIFIGGDQSLGVVHVVTNPAADHTHKRANDINITHTHAGSAANSPLIYSATNIPFASGGTGGYNDPILIGISNGVTNFSFVIDFEGVNLLDILGINETAFQALDTKNQGFSIRFLNLPFKAMVPFWEYTKKANNNAIFLEFSTNDQSSINHLFLGSASSGDTYTTGNRAVLAAGQHKLVVRDASSSTISPGRFRFTFNFE